MNDKNETNHMTSYWIESVESTLFPQINEDMAVDTVIVGAGITGITLAFLLVEEGQKVALIDANRIMNGTTGHTTAKITSQHHIIYDKLIEQLGIEKAEQYYQANHAAEQFINHIIETHRIDCDYSIQDAYIYTNSESYIEQIEREYKAYEKLSIDGELTNLSTLPFASKLAIVMKNQAQFHPLKYLNKLVEKLEKSGGAILENTIAVDLETGDRPSVILKNGKKISGSQVVLASHFPFVDWKGIYFARLYAERSYVVAAKVKEKPFNGMYISAESPTRSIRFTPLSKGEQLLLVGGESHKTGQGKSTSYYYQALSQFANEYFHIVDFSYHWSAQDLKTLDSVPYIGNITSGEENIYVATGYAKWGMTNGTAGAMLLRDRILNRRNDWQDLFNPSRAISGSAVKSFIVQNANVAKNLVSGKLGIIEKTAEDLLINEGAHINVNGKIAGGYKDEAGVVHIVDTTCTHLGCEVNWNSGDLSWDCPCHGSRFSYTGEVLEGPAKCPLKKIK